MRSFSLEIVTPDGLAYSGEAESLLIRTTDGDVEILAAHADFVAALAIGRARILKDGESRFASVQGGFITVEKGAVKVVATTFEFAESIDTERAKRAAENAEAKRAQASTARDLALAEARLKRALNRLNVADMK